MSNRCLNQWSQPTSQQRTISLLDSLKFKATKLIRVSLQFNQHECDVEPIFSTCVKLVTINFRKERKTTSIFYLLIDRPFVFIFFIIINSCFCTKLIMSPQYPTTTHKCHIINIIMGHPMIFFQYYLYIFEITSSDQSGYKSLVPISRKRYSKELL